MTVLSAETIRLSIPGAIRWVQGPESNPIEGVCEPDSMRSGTVVFLGAKTAFDPSALSASMIIAEEKSLNRIQPLLKSHQTLYACTSLKEAMSRVLALFNRPAQKPTPGISPRASIASSAKVSPTAIIGALAHVGEGAVIGDGAWIQPGAIIEDFAQVGPRTRVQAHAVVGAYCVVGADCQIGPGTVIGSDGFGFNPSPTAAPVKVPQIGNVVIGNSVEFGANCAVDRATIGSTQIGDGNKFDNLCHVAHNCKIGKNGLFAGGFFIAGSSQIADHFMCGGNVVIADHVQICSNVTLGGRSTVTKDITEPGAYTGYPLQPLKDGLRTIANLANLTELRERVKILEDEIEQLKK